MMNAFDATERRVERTCARFARFPRDPAILVRLVRHIAGNVQDSGNTALRRHGINHTDYNVLTMLYGSEDGTSTPSRLARAAGEKVANMTRVCDVLCEKKLVRRTPNPQDRRSVTLRLAPRGETLTEQLLGEMVDLLNASVRDLDARERATLERLLKKMLASTERMPEAS